MRRQRSTGAHGKGIDAARAVSVLRQMVSGLLTLHAKGKLHRDVKPSNVLVTREGRVVILDFGLTSDLGPRSGEHADQLAGTPAYLAPEQHIGAPPSEATDWYSVGVTIVRSADGAPAVCRTAARAGPPQGENPSRGTRRVG